MTETSANRTLGARDGFTLLEIIIALSLVAILVSASIPYLFDSFAASEGDRIMDSIAAKAQETRAQALEKGESRRLKITPEGLEGSPIPPGWTLEIKGLNHSKFHAPSRNQPWEFSAAGICEPISLRLSRGDQRIVTTFDALTAQPVHDED